MKRASISVDFSEVTGRIKPMHGVGQPPLTGLSCSLFHYLTRAGIPYSRLHDVGGWMGGGLYVDIPNLFRDPDADECDPASYDFAFTDRIIEGLVKAGVEPYFRLGVTIENAHAVKAYRIFPPKDTEKWARICEHVVAHYIDGWANGFRFPISYWEIWNEPDDCYTTETAAMWRGTPEEYYHLYEVTAKHLKAAFGDRIKVGGYASCGLYEYKKDPDLCGLAEAPTYIHEFTLTFLHGFLRHLRDTATPLDFFSWHAYDRILPKGEDITEFKKHAAYIRALLDAYGYREAEHHLNEWNMHYIKTRRDSAEGAARTLYFMLMMQNTSTDLCCYYDAGIGYGDYRGLLNPDTGYPYRTYYTFSMFNTLYRLGNAVKVEGSGEPLALAAAEGARAAVVIANREDDTVRLSLSLTGFTADVAEVLRVDEENRYTLTGESLGDTLLLPPHSCTEIRLYRLAE